MLKYRSIKKEVSNSYWSKIIGLLFLGDFQIVKKAKDNHIYMYGSLICIIINFLYHNSFII
jgi:hypothetical protein